MFIKFKLSLPLAALLSLFCSVASAGGESHHQSCGGNNNGNLPCGTLTIENPKKGTATNFYSDLYSGSSSAQKSSGLITDMQTYFDQAPFIDKVGKTNQFNFNYGALNVANVPKGGMDIVTYSFLGASADDTDKFTVTGGTVTGSNPFNNQTTPFGATITDTIKGTGSLETLLGFKFTDGTKSVANGCFGITCMGKFGILDQKGGYTIDGKNYAALLIYNDTGSSDADFNDMVIGVNSKCVSAVPEPGTYAMLLAGLGLIGFIPYRPPKMAVAA